VTEPLRARLTGRASRYVQLLRDFGHLDERGVHELVLAATDEATGSGEAVVGLQAIRRLAARQLFLSGADDLREERGILTEDWTLLFS
jgi:hypothetical protein